MVQKNQRGFTLVEILIVVIILAVLAAIVVPQFSSSTEEAKLAVLRSDLATMRKAVELYYHQHNSTYPGAVDSVYSSDANPASWFVDQLTLYTNVRGKAVSVKDTTHKYGPYLKKGILVNPFDNSRNVKVVTDEDDMAVAAATGDGGWIFYSKTGQLFANDGWHGEL
jgi:general secretion pathway protein G